MNVQLIIYKKAMRSIYTNTFISGTRLAMFRIIKTSPGWNPNMLEGHTLESAQAITMNCTWIYQLRPISQFNT